LQGGIEKQKPLNEWLLTIKIFLYNPLNNLIIKIKKIYKSVIPINILNPNLNLPHPLIPILLDSINAIEIIIR
jgi:hypothetical protein